MWMVFNMSDRIRGSGGDSKHKGAWAPETLQMALRVIAKADLCLMLTIASAVLNPLYVLCYLILTTTLGIIIIIS